MLKNLRTLFVAGLFGMTCSVVFADTDASASATEKKPLTVPSKVEAGIKRGGQAVGNAVEHGGRKTKEGIEHGVSATGKAIERTSKKLGLPPASSSTPSSVTGTKP